MGTLLYATMLAIFFVGCSGGTFTIENDKFIMNGKNFQIMSGSFHYSRIPSAGWDDRLKRLAAMGMNTIQTYVPWNWHENTEGTFDFEGDRDLSQFLTLCKQNNLTILLGAGPYIGGDWEFGGLPWWLLRDGSLNIRTYVSSFTNLVSKYLTKVHSIIKPHLIENGGNIIMVQIECEFGSFGDVVVNPKDLQYMEYLVNETRHNLGDNVILYTTDIEISGSTSVNMKKGSLKGSDVITLGEHGSSIGFVTSCLAQSTMNDDGKNPCMDSQYATGGASFWGQPVVNTSTSSIVSGISKALKNGDSFNLYMGFGGTNVGWYAGATGAQSNYTPYTTSYDYDSPVSENGDHGFGIDGKDKFSAILNVTSMYYQGTIPPEPEFENRIGFGTITLTEESLLLSSNSLEVLTKWNGGPKVIPSNTLIPMEFFNQSFGSILYRATARATGDTMSFGYPSDVATVFVGSQRQGSFFRSTFSGSFTLRNPVQLGETVDILVEAMGRIDSGGSMIDRKGLASDVLLNQSPLSTNWSVYNLQLSFSDIELMTFSPVSDAKPSETFSPTVYKGFFTIPSTVTSCYVETTSFTKGVVWINGNNVGRYWNNMGPQQRIYIYKSLLHVGNNSIHVLEYDSHKGTDVNFATQPKWGA